MRVPFEGTRDEALQTEADIRKARRPARATCFEKVDTLLNRYLEVYETEHLASGTKKQREKAEHIRRHFGKHLLQHITAQDVEAYKAARLRSVKHTTVNKELSVLSGLFRWAVDMDVLNEQPCKVRRFPPKLTKAPVPKVPSRDVVEKILAAAPARVRGLFRLMFALGLRSEEARHLRTEHWNTERTTLTVTGKGGKTRSLPVVNAEIAAELTTRAAASKSGYL